MPSDSSPVLHAFGPHAQRIAALINRHPPLAVRLFCAPKRALHAVAAFLHSTTADDAEVAARLKDDDPRDLLAVAIPGAPARLYRTLDRAGDTARGVRFYQRVGRIAAGPFSNLLFGSRGEIGDRLLGHIEKVSEMGDGALHGLPISVLADPSLTASVAAVVALLRAHGCDPDAMLRSFPASASLRSVERRLVEMVSELSAPPCPVALAYPWRQVTSVAELRAISTRHHMCMTTGLHGGSSYWLRLLDRSAFLLCEAPFFLVEVERITTGLWCVREVRDARNRVPDADTRRKIGRELETMGFHIAELHPRDALTCLAARTSGAMRRAQREFDNLADEFALELT